MHITHLTLHAQKSTLYMYFLLTRRGMGGYALYVLAFFVFLSCD